MCMYYDKILEFLNTFEISGLKFLQKYTDLEFKILYTILSMINPLCFHQQCSLVSFCKTRADVPNQRIVWRGRPFAIRERVWSL